MVHTLSEAGQQCIDDIVNEAQLKLQEFYQSSSHQEITRPFYNTISQACLHVVESHSTELLVRMYLLLLQCRARARACSNHQAVGHINKLVHYLFQSNQQYCHALEASILDETTHADPILFI